MTRIEAWRRETVYVNTDIRVNPWPAEFKLRRYRLRSITTTRPSWGKAPVGKFKDVLERVKNRTDPADVSALLVRHTTKPGLRTFMAANEQPLEVDVLDRELPSQRRFPFYSEINSFDCLRGFCTRGLWEFNPSRCTKTNSDLRCYDLPWGLQGRLTHYAIQLARSFGIEPMKQAQVAFEGTKWDQNSIKERIEERYGYKDLVLKGAIAPPIIWCGSINREGENYDPDPYFLKLINELAPRGSMAYCADEPSWNGIGNGMSVEAAIERVRLVQMHAPRLIPMIPTGGIVLEKLREAAPDLPIRYCINQCYDSPSLLSGEKGSYFSCSAQGCGDIKDDTEPAYPVAVVEGDPDKDFQGAIKFAYFRNANFALYYTITKRLQTCWREGGIYNEGGNGDGTAMYINPSTGLTMPSARMMHWHKAQQVVEKQMLA